MNDLAPSPRRRSRASTCRRTGSARGRPRASRAVATGASLGIERRCRIAAAAAATRGTARGGSPAGGAAVGGTAGGFCGAAAGACGVSACSDKAAPNTIAAARTVLLDLICDLSPWVEIRSVTPIRASGAYGTSPLERETVSHRFSLICGPEHRPTQRIERILTPSYLNSSGATSLQVMAPHHPLVPALGRRERVLDALRRQRFVERLGAGADEGVVLADAHPQQLDLLVRRRGVLEEVGVRLCPRSPSRRS